MKKYAFTGIRPAKLNFYLRCMKKFGFNDQQVLSGTGLTESRLSDRNYLVETSDYIGVVSNMMNLTNSPILAFELGKELQASDLGVLGHAFSACENAAQGVSVWQEYSNIFFGDLISVKRTVDDMMYRFEFTPQVKLQPHLLQFFIEEKINFEVPLYTEFNNCKVKEHFLRVNYPAPSHAALYDTLMGTKVNFNTDKIVYSVNSNDEYYSKRFPSADSETLEICINYLKEISASIYSNTTFTTQLRFSIKEHLPDILTAENMAKEFSCSYRTFCRNLEAEETTYMQVVEKVRERLTKNYLATTTMSLEEMAGLVGYSNAASLGRAFKCWTGKTITAFKISL